jgi:MoaA/NifB/PqqE/SkfB family radical SAM enzyme
MALTREVDKEILERLVKWVKEGKAPPVRCVILPTNRCNLRCIFCGGVYEREAPNKWFPNKFSWKDELSDKKWIEIVKEASSLGVREWLISGGGEPMVRSNTVIEILNTIKRTNPNSVIELSTNSTLITKEIAEKIVLSGCDYLQTGVDGPNPDVHDFLRGVKGSFKRTINAIKYISLAKKKYGKEKPTIKVHVVLCAKNYDKLPEMLKVVHSAGANFFAVAAMRVYGGGQEEAVNRAKIKMSEEQKKVVHEVWKEVEELAKEFNMQLGPAFYEGLEEVSQPIEYKISQKFEDRKINHFLSAFCYAPFYGCIIDWAGNVGPCPCAGSVKHIADNSLLTTSLENVWYGKFFTSVRECMLEGKQIKLEEILPEKNFDELRGLPLHPCEACGINVERKEISERLFRALKGESLEQILKSESNLL